MNEKLNKLNCMNYCVEDGEGVYYLTNGLRSLYWYSKRHNVNFKYLCNTLSTIGYHVLSDEITQIAMI